MHFNEDPFRELDAMPVQEAQDPELYGLIQKMRRESECLYSHDINIPPSFDRDDEHWQETVLPEAGF